jgi:hypothetical protein
MREAMSGGGILALDEAIPQGVRRGIKPKLFRNEVFVI